MLDLNLRTTQATPEQSRTPDPLTQSPPQSGEDLPPSSTSSSEATHFDDLLDGPGAGEGAGPAVLSKDDFFRLFYGTFQAASLMTGLKSLSVSESDDKARAASGALYDTIQDIPALRFLLSPQGKWFQRVIIIGSFAVPMAQAVGAEMAERAGPAPQTFGDIGGIPMVNLRAT